MTRLLLVSALCATTLGLAVNSASGQSGNMSDVTGATASLYSRGISSPRPAPPLPPATAVVTPGILDALCVSRADALLTLAILSDELDSEAEARALTVLRGGPGAAEAAQQSQAAIERAGAPAGAAQELVDAVRGLLDDRPTPPDLAHGVARFNRLMKAADETFLASPPDELLAFRGALVRLTAAAHEAAGTGLSDLGWFPGVQYANGAPWLAEGVPLELPRTGSDNGDSGQFVQFGTATSIEGRRFVEVGRYEGVSLLAEAPVAGEPTTLYVPLLAYCDVELQPYVFQPSVLKP